MTEQERGARRHRPARAAGTPPGLSRRSFLAATASLAALGACSADGDGGGGEQAGGGAAAGSGTTTSAVDLPVPELDVDPFALGVASGDPLPDGIVLWTRLVGSEGPVATGDVPVRWELAVDDGFADVVADGTAVAAAVDGHAVHVDVRDLAPATTYWYRFAVGDRTSATGRTRTAPATTASPAAVTFAVASCQAYQSGWYTAYRHLAAEDVDAVLFLGDYIYEYESSVEVRPHGLLAPSTLEEYRAFYELNRRDADLQAAHAAHPWIVTWDDHEVEDNYAALVPGELGRLRAEDAPGGFPAIRAAAYQAWWEHMPVRMERPDPERGTTVHRDLTFGDLVSLAVLDTRQHRTEQPKGEGAGAIPRAFGGGPQLPGAFDPEATMLGDEQEAWLAEVLTSSEARWNVIAQQSVLAEVDRSPGDPSGGFSMDSWDGYVVPRQRLLDLIAEQGVQDVVSLGGDIHTSAVTDLHLDPKDPTSPLVGTELIAPSISALEKLLPEFVAGALANEHIHLYDTEHRGYLVVAFTEDEVDARFTYTDATVPDAPATPGTRWRIPAGTPGAQPA